MRLDDRVIAGGKRYRVYVPSHEEVSGALITLMIDSNGTIVCITAASNVAMIEIWGLAQATTARLLKSLPFELHQGSGSTITIDATTVPQLATTIGQTGAQVCITGG
jgi:hypothetical protein